MYENVLGVKVLNSHLSLALKMKELVDIFAISPSIDEELLLEMKRFEPDQIQGRFKIASSLKFLELIGWANQMAK